MMGHPQSETNRHRDAQRKGASRPGGPPVKSSQRTEPSRQEGSARPGRKSERPSACGTGPQSQEPLRPVSAFRTAL